MKVLSLFDGISCGMLALQRAGIPVECYDAFEIDKYAVTVSKRNFPVIVHHGNVYDGDFTKFQGYDLLLGGSPCTYWSISAVMSMTTLQEKPINIWLRSPDADSVTNRSVSFRQKKEKGRTDHEEVYHHRKCRCYGCDHSGYHHREKEKVR